MFLTLPSGLSLLMMGQVPKDIHPGQSAGKDVFFSDLTRCFVFSVLT